MAPTEAKKTAAEKTGNGVPDGLPPVVPMRKRPWVLALAVVCFAAWLAFLVAMALQP